MSDPVVAKIQSHPKYQELTSKRNSFGVFLTIGIPIGMGVIIFTIVITGIYVRRANNEYDALTADILKDATK